MGKGGIEIGNVGDENSTDNKRISLLSETLEVLNIGTNFSVNSNILKRIIFSMDVDEFKNHFLSGVEGLNELGLVCEEFEKISNLLQQKGLNIVEGSDLEKLLVDNMVYMANDELDEFKEFINSKVSLNEFDILSFLKEKLLEEVSLQK